MTEVLPAPGTGAPYFGSPLGRSSSHNLLSLNASTNSPTEYPQHPQVKASFGHTEYAVDTQPSAPSSAPSSPQLQSTSFSRNSSYTSTPASSLSFDVKDPGYDNDEGLSFPCFDEPGTYSKPQDDTTGRTSSVDTAPTMVPPDKPQSRPTNHKRHSSSDFSKLVEDDNALENEPTRHVDYLSHEWKEEDIWSSWRYITSRRNVFPNSTRLENASWRTWAKAKNSLKTISPETLNWLKDCDVTWLYGPLQNDHKKPISAPDSPPPSRLSTSSSFLHNKKPILKKKSYSEAILQRSISSHSLLRHASAILQAQESSPNAKRAGYERATSDFVIGPYSVASSVLPTPVDDSSHTHSSASVQPSLTSSGLQSPVGERKHIHFNNEVVQCIAVDSKDEEDEEPRGITNESDDQEEDNVGVVMMRRITSKSRMSNRSTPRGSFSESGKTIAPLPSTTLKYRGDTPEPDPEQQKMLTGGFWPSATRLTSPSQETLRPSRPSANFLLDDDDEDPDLGWHPPQYSGGSTPDNEYDPGPGMRRTESGMFMPYDEEDEDATEASLFGRVIDTVNTARDIAHVIWNVGWRR